MWLRYSGETGEIARMNNNGNLREAVNYEFSLWSGHYNIDKEMLEEWINDFYVELDNMGQHMSKGLELLREIIIESSQTPFDTALVTGKSEELGKVDTEISNLGKSRPLISQLSTLFKVELGQIEDCNFFTMLNQWKQAYEGLNRRVSIMREEIMSTFEELKNR